MCMYILNSKRVILVVCICLAFLWGCDSKSKVVQKKPQIVRKKIQVEQEITKTEVNEVTARSSGSNGSEDVGKAISGDNVQHLNKKSSGAEDSAAPGVDKEKSKFSESPTMLPTVDGRTIEAEQNSVTAVDRKSTRLNSSHYS